MSELELRAEQIAAYYQPPPTGRPSDIGDADTLKELFKAVEAGNYLETACELADVSVVTVHNWRKRGEAGEEPYVSFVKALKRASARAEALAVANVRQAGKLPQFWAAEMTYLERRHPERWGKRSEEGNSPRVVVQIGVKDSDVQVQIGTSPVPQDTFACSTQALSAPLHSLTEAPASDNQHNVTLSTAVPAATHQPGRTVRRGTPPRRRVAARRKLSEQSAPGLAEEKKGDEEAEQVRAWAGEG